MRSAAVWVMMGLLTAPVQAQDHASAELNSEPERITDEAIYADFTLFDRIQAQLKALNENGRSASDYHFSKAQAWVDFARNEYSENDRSRVIEEALNQALFLIRAMETNQPDIPMDTPLVTASRKIRQDLWDKAAQMKQHPGFACGSHLLPEWEVRLVQAGHEEWEMGWRHALGDVREVEKLVGETERAMAACAVEPAPAIETPAVENTVTNHFSLAYFDFDLDDPTSRSAQELNELVDFIAATEGVQRVRIFGYTDRLGSETYNLKLSQRRVGNVKAMLVERGIDGDIIEATGLGETNPVAPCPEDEVASMAELKECLGANRRVEIEVDTAKQTVITQQALAEGASGQ